MPVVDDAVSKIRELILSGELQPGDRLPHEAQLADRLGISRNSMREAVRALEQMRVLDVRHGSGTYIASLLPEELLEGLSFAVEVMRDDTLQQVVEVRQLLEPAATRLAVGRMTPEHLARIRTAFHHHREQTSIEALVHCDLEFHAAIVRATGNQTLISLLEGLSNSTVRYRIWAGIVTDDAVGHTLDQHRLILDAIEAGDAHGAEASALVHILHARRWLDAHLSARRVPAIPGRPGRPQPVEV